MLTLIRRILHIHSPSLVAIGKDSITTKRMVNRCGVCSLSFLPPLTDEQRYEIMMRAGQRAHDLICDCGEDHGGTVPTPGESPR